MGNELSLADEIAAGKGMTFAAAAALFPPLREGRPVSPTTVGRWCWHGNKTADGRTVKLEAVRIGCRWLTTRAAVAAFIREQQALPADQPNRVPSKRDQRVERELATMGV